MFFSFCMHILYGNIIKIEKYFGSPVTCGHFKILVLQPCEFCVIETKLHLDKAVGVDVNRIMPAGHTQGC